MKGTGSVYIHEFMLDCHVHIKVGESAGIDAFPDAITRLSSALSKIVSQTSKLDDIQ